VCDGNWGGRSNLWRVPLDGGERTPLTSGASLHRYPALSADGRRVLYTNEQWQWLLWSVTTEGRLSRRVGGRGGYLSFSLSADGRRLAYDDLDAGPGEYPIRLLETTTGQERELARGSAPSLSPDGTALAFVREHDQPGLWVQDLESAPARRVFEGPLASLAAAWSPDARRLAFVASGRDTRELLVAERSGAGLRRLAEGHLGAPAWSPDGRWLAASGSCAGLEGLLLIDAAGGACQRLTPERSYGSAPLWDADSRGLRVLVGERAAPRLLAFDLAGRPGPVLDLQVPDQPSFWGLFELRAARDRLIAQVQTVDADLYVLDLP
jgi:Tol biopolymer transport system component